jgi:hypothetical protein
LPSASPKSKEGALRAILACVTCYDILRETFGITSTHAIRSSVIEAIFVWNGLFSTFIGGDPILPVAEGFEVNGRTVH